MSRIFLLFFVFAVQVLAAQDHQKTDSVYQLIRKHFNERNATAIYDLTGPLFRQSISAEQLQLITSKNLFPLGTMPAPEFIGSTNGVNKYKVNFGSVTLALFLSLDEQDKIQTLLFRQYDGDARKTGRVNFSNPLRTAMDSAVDKAVQSYTSLAATHGLVIGILKNGKRSYYGYGETEKGKGQLPDESTLFEIGSITKTFTATLLADAVLQKKLRLEDPVNKYLPDSIPKFVFEGKSPTLRMLADHSSGFPRMPDHFNDFVTDSLNPYKGVNHPAFFSLLKQVRLTRAPASRFEYSNLGFATLGVILERVYQKSFAQLVEEKITGVLNMKNTRQYLTAADSPRIAKGYSENGTYNGPWDFGAFAPAGALRSTATDLLTYAEAEMGKGPVPLTKAMEFTQITSFTAGDTKTGLSWFIIRPLANEIYFHNGGTGGYRSFLAFNKKNKTAVVLLSNTAIGTEGVGNELMRWLETH